MGDSDKCKHNHMSHSCVYCERDMLRKDVCRLLNLAHGEMLKRSCLEDDLRSLHRLATSQEWEILKLSLDELISRIDG